MAAEAGRTDERDTRETPLLMEISITGISVFYYRYWCCLLSVLVDTNIGISLAPDPTTGFSAKEGQVAMSDRHLSLR